MQANIKKVAPLSELNKRERGRQLAAFSLPIILALTSQNLLNIIDTWIVGQLGTLRLGAVALAGNVNWVLSSFFIGLGSGVQAYVSRKVGEDDLDGAVGALRRSLVFTVQTVIPFALLCAYLSDFAMTLLTNRGDTEILGTPYLAARLAGLPFLAANFAFRGYWNGLGLARIYLETIIVIHIVNVMWSMILVFGAGPIPPLGVFGAGVGSTIAQAVGTIYYVRLAMSRGPSQRFYNGGRKTALRSLLRLGAPAGLQSMLFSLGFLAFFWITDKLGPEALGASHVLVTFALVSILPSVGIGLGAASLVGQSLGAGRPTDARTWGWLALMAGTAFGLATGLLAIFVAPGLLSMFIGGDPETVALATMPLRIIGLVMIIDASGVVLSNTLIGAGAAKQVMVWSLATQWGVFLPVAWYFGLQAGHGLIALWIGFAIYRLIFGAAMVWAWKGDGWLRHKIT